MYQTATRYQAPPRMFLEQPAHSLRTQMPAYPYTKPAYNAPAPMVLPPIMHANEHSPSPCYSPGASDATVVDYANSPSPALSSKATSPAPLAALAAAAATKQAEGPVRRRRGGRGSRSIYTAEEKEMRRKISHSAIEKRRRERTNTVLKDLQEMVPWLSKSNKVQKLEILEAAAQYIKELRSSQGSDYKGSPVSSADTRFDGEEDIEIESNNGQSAMKLNFLLS
ncbi:hypothetical protein DL89DRAFT_264407 [Linderina pennispora]|uniref:BHLH domain-containing protein n=1 Tax=Linderina pennispora TaxID=61395 RepID=A0A1Y1WLY1_9FUNG|nr:uncharacterized protein DL89DRAFT_264407 [Linderina pennispora]ORX74569.1 hypothetical protein DL89DRAFT_264407 [Linderina pennispora]